MNEPKYTVGWYEYTPQQLEEFPPEYRNEIQSIRTFAAGRCLFNTPGEAQWFLNQIAQNNHEPNLRLLTPLGATGLFIVQRQPTESWPHFVFSKYVPPNNAHIIPVDPRS